MPRQVYTCEKFAETMVATGFSCASKRPTRRVAASACWRLCGVSRSRPRPGYRHSWREADPSAPHRSHRRVPGGRLAYRGTKMAHPAGRPSGDDAGDDIAGGDGQIEVASMQA